MNTLADALREAAELEKATWRGHQQIYAALGYEEFPPEHVSEAVAKAIEEASLSLGLQHERSKLFRVRKQIEEKRAGIVPEQDQCVFCGEPLGAPGDDGIRECPQCESKFDRSGVEVRA